jgi:polysaccharide chain length determinant protein (PEP-CTERM system associated)
VEREVAGRHSGDPLWIRRLPLLAVAARSLSLDEHGARHPPARAAEFVRSTITDTVAARLNSISQQILSRTRLERLIEEFNLYERERETMLIEDVVAQMRRDIRIDIVQPRGRGRNQDASSFTVGFESSNPRTALQVTERLATMFVQENLEGRELLADSTSQFLRSQLEEARRRLVEHEAKLEEFRRQNAGRLPSQLQSNLQMVQTTQQQLQANADAANRERDRLLVLETSIAEAATAASEAGPAAFGDGATGTAAQQLESARAALRSMELRLKPEHPDIIRAKRTVAELETKAEAEALAAAVSPTSLPLAVPGERGRTDRLTGMQIEAREIRARLETRKQEDARLQRLMASYTARLEAAPGLESELTELMRDYATLESQYTNLLSKSEAANMAVSLERRQVGEQFRVIDAARLPQRPTSPDRRRINLMGLMAGLGLGLALVALLEYRDTRLRTDEDVVISLALPVLAVIPLMLTSAERRQMRRRKLLLGLSGSVATVLVIAVILAWRMQILQAWVR